ncbi:MAG: hypothetical protein U0M50_05545 [Paramuribaculum sp.]
MKKLFLSLAVVMSVSLFSCNGGDAKADSDSAKESANTEAVVEEEETVVEETVVADSDSNKTVEAPAEAAK